nr:hypothetical protein L204_05109 [Cryptococcus depauperatus CBS 7855]
MPSPPSTRSTIKKGKEKILQAFSRMSASPKEEAPKEEAPEGETPEEEMPNPETRNEHIQNQIIMLENQLRVLRASTGAEQERLPERVVPETPHYPSMYFREPSVYSRRTESEYPEPRNLELNRPETFSGEAKQVNTFIMQIKNYTEARERSFPTDQDKILFASSLLVGHAGAWIAVMSSLEPKPIWLRNFDLFLNEIRRVYSPHYVEAEAATKLETMTPHVSVFNYNLFTESVADLESAMYV